MLERSLMTKRYGVPAFSLVTFLPWMVSPIVKPGPTVPLTVFAVAAGLPPAAASAAAATAPRSTDHVRVVLPVDAASGIAAKGGGRDRGELRPGAAGESDRASAVSVSAAVGQRRDTGAADVVVR